VIEAATAPVMTSVASFRDMRVSPRVCVDRRSRGPFPSADTGKSYEEPFAKLQNAAGEPADHRVTSS
jgi:hypothetical protein